MKEIDYVTSFLVYNFENFVGFILVPLSADTQHTLSFRILAHMGEIYRILHFYIQKKCIVTWCVECSRVVYIARLRI